MKIKKTHISISLLVLIVSFTVVGALGMLFSSSLVIQDVEKCNTPKSSAGEITIITPEEKIYTEPDSGYYPAIYGFENNKIGEAPSDWQIDPMDASSYIEVDQHLDGHNYVVEQRKNGGTMRANMVKEFDTNGTVGSVEFWFYKDTDSGTDSTRLYILSDAGDGNKPRFEYGFTNGDLHHGFWNTRTVVATNILTKNTWHHIKVEFDIMQGCQIRVDGILYGADYAYPFIDTPTTINGFKMCSLFSGGNPNYGTWIDAIGYSWDPDYDIGDNLIEGLLLSYDNTTTLDWQGYSLDGQNNVTILGNHTIPVPVNGTHTIQVFGNDSIGTTYESNIRQFAINYWEEQPLSLNVIYPSQNEVFGQISPDFLISGTGINASWYSLDYGATNFTFTGFSGKIDQTEWEGKSTGTVPIRFFANDSLGDIIFKDVLVVKDLITPIVNINAPTENLLFGSDPPNYDISITESNLEAYWYTLDDGTTNITISSLTGTVDQSEWDKRGNGTVVIKFYAEDEGNNEGFAEINVRKDINVPLITINSPGALDIFGKSAPEFDLSVVESNLDSMWYTMDDGITTFPFTELSGTIDSTEWNKFGNGMVVIKFFVEDKVGNIAFVEVQLEKDIIAPLVTINQPVLGEIFVDFPPIYSISIDELHSYEFWYSLDNGAHNYSITELVGALSQSSWDAIQDGIVTLRFYAEDEAGNVGESSVLITKRSTQTEQPPPGIPGYDLYLLLGALSIISAILIRKRVKS